MEDPKKLDAALKQVLTSGKPTLIEIISDPDKMAASTKRVD